MEINTDLYQIFNENNLKNLNEILKLPNDNYTCTECGLIPEILKIDYGTGKIEFNCETHGKKNMPLKDYLLEMSKNVYYNKKCSFCEKIQKDSPDFIFEYCLFCKKIICKKCQSKHKHVQILKLNDLDNKCQKHHNKLYEFFCKDCKKNFCSLCTNHEKHEEKYSSYDFLPTNEIKTLKKSNDLFKKEMEILPYLIKINDLLITCQSKYPFNYFHNTNLKTASNSFVRTDLFIKEINEFKDKIQSDNLTFASVVRPVFEGIKILDFAKKEIEQQKKLLTEFNNSYNTSLNGNEKEIELNDKHIGDTGFELLSKIRFKNLEKLKLKGNEITNISPLANICNKNTKKLDLSFNKLSNISKFNDEKCDLKGLNDLYLNNNLIEDISVFANKEIFPQLKKLNLCNNRINYGLKDTQRVLEDLKARLIKLKYKNSNNIPYYVVANYSSVLTKAEDIEFLNERFKLKNPTISTIDYKLLYRGTRDGDRAKDFHDRINGISKTLCVVKTPKGLFGGYTEATWDGENCDKFDDNAFCFSLTLKKIYELIEGKDAIGCNKDYGPIFRFTFLLNDKYFEKNAFCYPKTPHFNVEENKFELSGGEKYPKVIEFEAYQITFD